MSARDHTRRPVTSHTVSAAGPASAVAAKRTRPNAGSGAAVSAARHVPLRAPGQVPETRSSAKSPGASVSSTRRPLAVGVLGCGRHAPASSMRSAVRSPTNSNASVRVAIESRLATNRYGVPSFAANVPSAARPSRRATSESGANGVPPTGTSPLCSLEIQASSASASPIGRTRRFRSRTRA